MDAALDAMVHFVNRKPSPACAVVLEFMHGAVQRVAADATAFAHRCARHSFLMLGQWASQAQTENGLCWVREFWEAMRPYLGAGVYVNYLSEGEGEERIRGAYGVNYGRLVKLKKNMIRRISSILTRTSVRPRWQRRRCAADLLEPDAFFDFFLSDLCIWQGRLASARLLNGFLSGYWQHGCTSPMMARSNVFITARNKHVVPKQRRMERLPSGYVIREFSDDSRGQFWYVVTAFEVVRARKCSR